MFGAVELIFNDKYDFEIKIETKIPMWEIILFCANGKIILFLILVETTKTIKIVPIHEHMISYNIKNELYFLFI